MDCKLEALEQLQQRVREATGPDRELDADIAEAFFLFPAASSRRPWQPQNGPAEPAWFSGNNFFWWKPPHFTTDPDGLGACVALLRSVLPGAKWAKFHMGSFEIHEGGNWIADVSALANDCLTFIDAIISAKLTRAEGA